MSSFDSFFGISMAYAAAATRNTRVAGSVPFSWWSEVAPFGRLIPTAGMFDSSCPALCRASMSFCCCNVKDVDGRDKPGHDGVGGITRAYAASQLRAFQPQQGSLTLQLGQLFLPWNGKANLTPAACTP